MFENQCTGYQAILILLAAVMVAFSGCGPNGNEKASDSQSQNTEVNLQRQDSTRQYKFNIQLPEIIRTNAALRDTLVKLADRQQQSFTSRARKATAQPERPPWELSLKVTTTDSTRDFIALLGEGYEYMGGAHGTPFFVTFNYDRQNEHFVSLPDMLIDSTALVSISRHARRALAKYMMEKFDNQTPDSVSVEKYVQEASGAFMEGTAPRYSNYHNFLVQPQGLRFIFGAYQAGPYAIGTPEVEVPASVFRDKLEGEYKAWFSQNEE